MSRETTRQRSERGKRLIHSSDRPSVLVSQPGQRGRQLHRVEPVDETAKLSAQVITHAPERTPVLPTSIGITQEQTNLRRGHSGLRDVGHRSRRPQSVVAEEA